jgi:SpoVK/Ycf46/Vps4 family AAA+-type ATPase
MGYLLCGPVGTGKSFLAQCVSGEIGVPCVMLKNFRSKYVGETEGNLERVLSVLRAMGPVVVVVDEADAALGSRSRTAIRARRAACSRMIASQMGDTRYRGRIIWMLLTARPDLLPDRPQAAGTRRSAHSAVLSDRRDEIRQMFVILARKLGSKLRTRGRAGDSPAGSAVGRDIEGIVGRALAHLAARRRRTTSRRNRWRKSSSSSCRRLRGSSANSRKSRL